MAATTSGSQRGSWWPRTRKGSERPEQRYGVLEVSGYNEDGPRLHTDYHVVDLAKCAEVVRTFSAASRPGSERAWSARRKACEYARCLNAVDASVAA